MSIRAVIDDLLKEGRLWPLPLRIDSDTWERDMFVSNEILALLNGPWASEKLEKRCNKIHADLEAFVRGKKIYACLEPYKAQAAYMGRLDPIEDEVWDIRCVDPSPAVRVLGSFAEYNCFIALTCYPRSKLIPGINRPILGDRDSEAWKIAIRECRAEWRKLFSTYEAMHRGQASDYISNPVILD